MSPYHLTRGGIPSRFPRVSGDEPTTYPKPITDRMFSPRERG